MTADRTLVGVMVCVDLVLTGNARSLRVLLPWRGELDTEAEGPVLRVHSGTFSEWHQLEECGGVLVSRGNRCTVVYYSSHHCPGSDVWLVTLVNQFVPDVGVEHWMRKEKFKAATFDMYYTRDIASACKEYDDNSTAYLNS